MGRKKFSTEKILKILNLKPKELKPNPHKNNYKTKVRGGLK